MSKHEMIEKELVVLKKTSGSRESTNQELVTSVKMERDHYKLKWEVEKESLKKKKI